MLESSFNKAAGLQAYNFIKKRLQHMFSCEIYEILSESSHRELSCKKCVLKYAFVWDFEVFWIIQPQLRKKTVLLKVEPQNFGKDLSNFL